jgi:hypothetical protein
MAEYSSMIRYSNILGKIDIFAFELTKLYIWDSLFCIVTRLWARRSGVRFTTGGKIFFSFISKTFSPALGPTQTLTNGHRTWNFTCHLHLVPSLRKHWALPLLSPPLYAFMVCTGTTLHFTRETHPVNLDLKHQRYYFLTGSLFLTICKPPHNDL